MPKFILMLQSAANPENFLQSALGNRIQMIIIPVNFSSMGLASTDKENIYQFLLNSTKRNGNVVVTTISDGHQWNLKDAGVMERSENILRNGLERSMHLPTDGGRFLRLNAGEIRKLASIVINDLIGFSLKGVSLRVPFAVPALHQTRIGIAIAGNGENDIRAVTDSQAKVKVVLTFGKDVLPSKGFVLCWLDQPADDVIILKGNSELCFPDVWLELLNHFKRIKADVVLSTPCKIDHFLLCAKSLKEKLKNSLRDNQGAGCVKNVNNDGEKTHLPNCDLQLPQILRESLGSNSGNTIAVCCSPASVNEVDPKSTLEFGRRAKTVKNVVCVNEEPTAEEWKRRYEKEKEKTGRIKGKLDKILLELARFRAGKTANAEEKVKTGDLMKASTPNLEVEGTVNGNSPVPAIGSISADKRSRLEAERELLYQQLDKKDGELNQYGQ